jgi:hypothetical protein
MSRNEENSPKTYTEAVIYMSIMLLLYSKNISQQQFQKIWSGKNHAMGFYKQDTEQNMFLTEVMKVNDIQVIMVIIDVSLIFVIQYRYIVDMLCT